jgi:hypothetical protein
MMGQRRKERAKNANLALDDQQAQEDNAAVVVAREPQNSAFVNQVFACACRNRLASRFVRWLVLFADDPCERASCKHKAELSQSRTPFPRAGHVVN